MPGYVPVLTNRNLSGDEMATIFVKVLSKMERVARGARRAFIATVTRTGVRKIVEPRKRGR